MAEEKTLDISWETILKIFLALISFYILYLVRDILMYFFVALVISILFNPAIDFWQKRKIPRMISAIFVYLAIFGILGSVIYFLAPIFISEIQQFSQFFPQYFEKIAPPLKGLGIKAFESLENFIDLWQKELLKISANIFSAIASIFGGIFSAITILAISFFLSLEERAVERIIGLLSPKKYENYILNLWQICQKKVTSWFGARIFCCIFVGLASYFVLRLFNIKYSLLLALFSGIIDIVPILGPIFAGFIIVIIALFDSWLKTIFVIAAFVLIQQIEGNILTPLLTKRFLGLPPALVLVALLIGGKLWGILGAILAIPLFGIFFEFSREFLEKRKENLIYY
jgi:predicted PurR-regulated permease PerM